MGLSWTMTGFPIFVLVISILLGTTGGGQVTGGSTPPVIFNSNGNTPVSGNSTNVIDCTNYPFPGPACLDSQGIAFPTNGVIVCGKTQGGLLGGPSCVIQNSCPASESIFTPLHCSLGIMYLDSQTTAYINNGAVSTSKTSSIFAFGVIGVVGFIVFVGLAVGIAALAGLNIFGSGESPESVHILFIGGLMLGIWFYLSALEGFLVGSPNSFFTMLNSAFSNLGSTFYVLLTLVYTVGIIRTVSRGS